MFRPSTSVNAAAIASVLAMVALVVWSTAAHQDTAASTRFYEVGMQGAAKHHSSRTSLGIIDL